MSAAELFTDLLKSLGGALVAALFVAFALKGAYRVVFLARMGYISAYIQSFAVFFLQSITFAIGIMINFEGSATNVAWFAMCAYLVPILWWSRMLPRPDGNRAGAMRATLFAIALASIMLSTALTVFGAYAAVAAEGADRSVGLLCFGMGLAIATILLVVYFVRRRRARRVVAAPAPAAVPAVTGDADLTAAT